MQSRRFIQVFLVYYPFAGLQESKFRTSSTTLPFTASHERRTSRLWQQGPAWLYLLCTAEIFPLSSFVPSSNSRCVCHTVFVVKQLFEFPEER